MSNEYNNADPAQALDNFSKTIYGTPMPGIGDDDPGQQYLIGPGNGTQGYRTGASMSGSDSGFPWDDDEEETEQEQGRLEEDGAASKAGTGAATGAAVGGVAGLVDWTKPYPGMQGDGNGAAQNPASPRYIGRMTLSGADTTRTADVDSAGSQSAYPQYNTGPAGGEISRSGVRTGIPAVGTGGYNRAGNSDALRVGSVSFGNPNGDGNGLSVTGGPTSSPDSGVSAVPSNGVITSGTELSEKSGPLPVEKPAVVPPKLPKIAVKLHDDYEQLSNAVYEGDGGVQKGYVPRGWVVVPPGKLKAMGLQPEMFNEGNKGYFSNDGFFSALYYNKATGKYVLAFRGTQFWSGKDWWADAKQGVGHGSGQYTQAIELARQVAGTVGAGNLTYTGHSLGGGLAAAASLVTKAPAVTFNAAAVNNATLAPYHTDDRDANRLITSYVTPGEFVGDLQNIGTSLVGRLLRRGTGGYIKPPGNTQGNQIIIEPNGSRWDPRVAFNRHSISQFRP